MTKVLRSRVKMSVYNAAQYFELDFNYRQKITCKISQNNLERFVSRQDFNPPGSYFECLVDHVRRLF